MSKLFILLVKTFPLFVLILHSFAAYTQSNVTDSLKIDSLKKALLIEKEDTSKLNTLNSIIILYFDNLRDYNKSMQYVDSALKLSNKLNFKKGIADALFNKGIVNYYQNNYPEAVENLERSLKIRKELKDKRGCAYVYRILNAAYGMQGFYVQNVQYAYACLKLWEEIGDKEQVAISLSDIANIYISHDNYSEGYINAEKALKISRELGLKSQIAYSLGMLSDIAIHNGKLSDALAKHQEALKILKEAGDIFNYFAPDHYRSIGKIYQKQGETALDSGNKLTATEMFSNAQVNYKEALKYDMKNDVKASIATDYISLADIDILFNKRQEAESYLKKALPLAKSVRYIFAVRDAYYSLSRLDSINGNYKQAHENYKMYILYRDSVVNEESAKKAAQTQMQYEFDKKEAVVKAKQDEKDALAAAELKNQKLIRNFSLSGVIVVIFFAGYSFYRYRRKKTLQNQQALMNERLRISRELHDEVGATLSSISIFSQAAIQKNESGNMVESKKILERIGETSRDVMGELNDAVWLINPLNDNLQKIIQRISNYALPLCRTNNIHFEINTAASVENLALSVEKRKAIYLIIKEAINNSLKYAAAKNLAIQFEKNHNALHISIKDDGKGFVANNASAGNGLNNMQQRAKDVNGKIDVDSAEQKGTEIVLEIPLTNIGD